MPRNDGVRFTASPLKVPLSPHHHLPLFSNLQFTSQTVITSTQSSIDQFLKKFHKNPRKAQNPQKIQTLIASSLARTQFVIDQFFKDFKKNHKRLQHSQYLSKSSLLCSASLALTKPDELAGVAQPKGGGSEERVLISEVFVRNKDGEELERKDFEIEALAALKACRPNSALTVREVQEDVHRIISSGYFCSCMPVAVDTRDGIRLVFQVGTFML